jgi:hypothetical protein
LDAGFFAAAALGVALPGALAAGFLAAGFDEALDLEAGFVAVLGADLLTVQLLAFAMHSTLGKRAVSAAPKTPSKPGGRFEARGL